MIRQNKDRKATIKKNSNSVGEMLNKVKTRGSEKLTPDTGTSEASD